MTVTELIRPSHIEGDYDEIVAWMDEHPVSPVQFWDDRGSENSAGDQMEFGLFSVIEDRDDEYNGMSFVTFRYDIAWIEGLPVDIEDPENSHRIVF